MQREFQKKKKPTQRHYYRSITVVSVPVPTVTSTRYCGNTAFLANFPHCRGNYHVTTEKYRGIPAVFVTVSLITVNCQVHSTKSHWMKPWDTEDASFMPVHWQLLCQITQSWHTKVKWVTLSFAKSKVENRSLRPKLGLKPGFSHSD